MKTTIRFICILSIISLLLSLSVNGKSTDYSWYIIKNGNDTPKFPNEAELVKTHGGYFIDEYAASTGDKKIYLTFDAGYENGNIEKTLDILKNENIPGAFFILSNIIYKNPDIINRMFNEGHEVCNHTKNHKNLSNLTDEEIKANLEALESLCLQRTGCQMKKYFRFPEGKFDERTIKIANSLNYKTFFWSLAYADWDNNKQLSEEKAINKLISNTHNGAVILLHPTSDTNVKILPKLIKKWREMGYSFGTLEELIERNG